MQTNPLLLTFCAVIAFGQTVNPAADSKEKFVGLPQYGVTLSPAAPIVVDHPSQTVIGHVVRADALTLRFNWYTVIVWTTLIPFIIGLCVWQVAGIIGAKPGRLPDCAGRLSCWSAPLTRN